MHRFSAVGGIRYNIPSPQSKSHLPIGHWVAKKCYIGALSHANDTQLYIDY
jgi:hypothetical protein